MLCGIYNKLLGWEDFQLEALSAIIRFIFISQSFIWNHLQREVLQHTILIIEMTSSGGDFGNPDTSAHICAHTDRFGLCFLYYYYYCIIIFKHSALSTRSCIVAFLLRWYKKRHYIFIWGALMPNYDSRWTEGKRCLIERSSVTTNDPCLLAVQWLEMHLYCGAKM